jgi:hypothetical protein
VTGPEFGSVKLPANLVTHLTDNLAAYIDEGDREALAKLVCLCAEVFEVDHEPADVHQRLVPADARRRAKHRLQADLDRAVGRMQEQLIAAEQERVG